MSKKVLLLCENRNNYFFPYVDSEKLILTETYKPTKNKLQYYAVKILKKVPYLSYFCYGSWKKSMSDFDKIVIFDEGYDPPMQTFLKKYKIPVFVYVWNSVVSKHTKLYRSIKRTKWFPIYSFEKQDCITYHLKYNSMVYSYRIVDKYVGSSKGNKKYTLFFVGYDKGRKKWLDDMKAFLDNWGMSACFRIIKLGERMEYSEYLTILNDSTAILDIVQEGQTGLTIRVMESLFFEKKLVTTNRSVREYDFYNPSNIFIWGEDSEEDLPDFLNGVYESLPREIVEQYDVEQWVQRFVSEEEK